MKRYGLWRYLLILLILGLGIVYSLPNLYAPDPAVQISYTSSSQTADEFLACLLYTSPSPRDGHQSRMPSSA